MPTITLCIINHNGAGYLRQALTAIGPFADQFDEVLVIDNASTDDSVAYARSVHGVAVAQLPRNLGPGAARNLGFTLARHDLILFQDNDICLGPDAAPALSSVIQQGERTLIAVPRVVYRDHPEIIQYDSADCHLLGMMTVRHANTKVSDVPASTQCTSSLVTACFMIHRQRWHNGPLFDECLFFNLEDHDLGVRANLLGYDVVSVAKVRVLHGGGTAGLSWRPGYAVPWHRMFFLIRNRWWIIIRYVSLKTLLKLLPLLLLFESFQLAGVVRKGFWRAWLQAFGSTVLHLPRLLRQRWHYQRLRRKPDMAILRGGPLPLTTAMASGRLAARSIRLFETILDRYIGKIFPQLNRP